MHDTCDESRPPDGRNLQQAVTVEGPVYFVYVSFLTSQREGWSLWFYLHSSCKLPDLPTR